VAADDQLLLLARARRGEMDALGELLDQFRPYVRILVQAAWRRAAQARQEDSDLIQDAMLIVHQAFPRFRGDTVAQFAAWLRSVSLRTIGQAEINTRAPAFVDAVPVIVRTGYIQLNDKRVRRKSISRS
jgi:hypothetical protein